MFSKMRFWPWLTLIVVLVVCGHASAQKVMAPLPEYDVAVFKASKTLSGDSGTDTDDSTFKATNVTMRRLLALAFEVRESQIFGLPSWAESERWDVSAKVTDPDIKVLENLSRPQRRKMLATLLIERLNLKTHIEAKTLPLYELVVAKNGPKLEAIKREVAGDGDMSTNNTTMKASAVSMNDFAANISFKLDRTVIDRTGLKGRYDFQLKWSPDDVANGGKDNGVADAAPIIFTAIEEQMGLKLQPGKGPVNTLVVDHIEQPSEN